MAKRERLEDLGRICVLIDKLIEHEIWEWNQGNRNKDTAEWFQSLDKDRQFDIIHSLAYSISHVHDELYEIYQIARWGDDEDEA